MEKSFLEGPLKVVQAPVLGNVHVPTHEGEATQRVPGRKPWNPGIPLRISNHDLRALLHFTSWVGTGIALDFPQLLGLSSLV